MKEEETENAALGTTVVLKNEVVSSNGGNPLIEIGARGGERMPGVTIPLHGWSPLRIRDFLVIERSGPA